MTSLLDTILIPMRATGQINMYLVWRVDMHNNLHYPVCSTNVLTNNSSILMSKIQYTHTTYTMHLHMYFLWIDSLYINCAN